MKAYTSKTYVNSYLYNNKITNNAPANPGTLNDSAISSFIIKSTRIDKNSDAFKGVIEDVKRQQTSAVLLSVLMHPLVELCIGDAPLPRAFTVFGARDQKDDKKYKVFIDVTGKIEYRDGYYIAKRNEIDKLCALLLDSLVYLLYKFYPTSLFNNSALKLESTECFVSMFTYILDYLRVIGYSNNKKKISYVVGLYYLNGVIGCDLDDYNKSIAAKVAGINPAESKAYDLYVDSEEIFTNIGTFIPALANIFKLKGLDLPTFIYRWSRSFGTGTEYGTELYTSFLCMVLNAYMGCYIVQQRQIETACGSNSLLKLATTFIKIGSTNLKSSNYVKEVANVVSNNSKELADTLSLKESILETGLQIKSFTDKDEVVKEAKDIIDKCNKARLEDRLSIYAENSISRGIALAYYQCINNIRGTDENVYSTGSLTEAAKVFKNTLDNRQKDRMCINIDRDVTHLSELVRESSMDKDARKFVNSVIIELRDLKRLI